MYCLGIELLTSQLPIECTMPGGWPDINVGALYSNFPNAQTRSLISLEYPVRFFKTTFHINKRLEFRFVGSVCCQHSHHALGSHRSITKANFRLKSCFHIDIPLKPLRVFIRQLDSRQGNLFRNIPSTLNTSPSIDSSDFHNQRITIAKITQCFSIVMVTTYSCRLHTNGVYTTMRHTTLPNQGKKSNMPTTIVTTIEIRERRIGCKPKAINFEQFW